MNSIFKSFPHKTLTMSLLTIGLSLPIYANADLSSALSGGANLSSDSMTDTIKAKATNAVADHVTGGGLSGMGAAAALGSSANIGGVGSSLGTGSMTDTVKAKATDEVKSQVSKHGKQIKDKLTSSATGALPSAGASAGLGGSANLGGVGASLGSGLGVKLP